MTKNLHPIFDRTLSKREKESLLHQNGFVLWMTGLSGSGKSTIAIGVERRLHKEGFLTRLLDGDNMRTGLNSNLGFSNEDREENIRRVAETAKLFIECGVVTICSFVSPTVLIRKMAQDIIGSENFREVFISASFDTCAKRDVKGLYQKALRGEIEDFTGLDAPYEPSEKPFITINTENEDVNTSVNKLFKAVLPLIR
jgi:adenylylsulfate kinase